jgi:hypothetical protein
MEEAGKMPVVILSLHQKWWQKMAAGDVYHVEREIQSHRRRD